MIEVQQGARTMQTYYIGEEVVESVFLKEVLSKEVILDNRRTNALEHLRMDQDSLLKLAAAAVPPSARDRAEPAAPQRAANLMEFKREELGQKLMDNYEDIASKVDVRVKEDDKGNVIGLTASNLSGVELAEELGLKDNDVLTSINNEKIESVEGVYDVIEKYRNASTFRLGLMRDGRPMYLTYRLQ
jgi:type II secretory pathway component PulC